MYKLTCELLLATLFIASTVPAPGQNATRYYEVVRNKSSIPFPTAIPVLRPEAASSFDWERYVSESISPADKVYRLNLAIKHVDSPEWRNTLGAGSSTADESVRARTAAEALDLNCAAHENAYRERLKNQPELIATLNQFINSHRQAVEASVKLVGGSWGGSGTKAAYPLAKLKAFAIYRIALLDLRSSLDLQDIPEISLENPAIARPR